jgi:ferric-dicitrate binding protein FerR (iron transport regulator)
MSVDRFQALAQAYGGTIDRWPIEARAAARQAASDPHCQAILEEAQSLDALLGRWKDPAPGRGLIEQIVASAPVFVRRARIRRRIWWSGIGVAAALAGALAGSVTVAVIATSNHAPTEITTAFGDFSDAEL